MLFETPRSIAVWCRLALLVLGLSTSGENALHAQVTATGGFVDSATSGGLRPHMSSGQIQTFLPSRGKFTFPAPYSTTGIRVTNGADCGGGDCVIPVGYSYWNNINNHVGSDTMLIFLGMDRTKGGGGPTLFSYSKSSGETRNLGPIFSSDSPYSWSTGEGWYFSRNRASVLYMNDGARMMRYDVMAHTFETVYDVRDALGGDKYIWQMHSSNDDRVHSATVRSSSSYEMLGCVAYREDTRQTLFYPKKGDFDECQVDKSGRWLVIKENVDGRYGEDNRIVDLQTGSEQVLLDENGAAGHSDVGYGYMVTEDNMYQTPHAVRVMQFGHGDNYGGTVVYQLPTWGNSGLGHIAHGNAQPGVSISSQMACNSNASRIDEPRANEIVCFRLDGSLNTLIVAPNLEDLNASGGGSDDYMKLPKGNLDVTGEYFIWTANAGTNRVDAFIVRIPQGALGVSSTTAPPSAPPTTAGPAPTPAPPSSPAPGPAAPAAPAAPAPVQIAGNGVRWTNVVNATVSGSTLQKSGGCGGCADAGAVSEQRISGRGGVEFVAADVSSLRYVGLTAGGSGTDPAAIAFAIRLQGGVAEIRESGAYKADVRFGAGDVFGISVEGTAVQYSKNGSVFYTSGGASGGSMQVAAALYDDGAAVANAVITTEMTSAAVAAAPASVDPPAAQPAPVDAPAPAPTSPVDAASRIAKTRQRWPTRAGR